MIDAIIQREPALLIPMIALVGTAIVFTVWLIAHYWNSSRRQEIEASLKQDMLNRGMAAADIERVMLASSVKSEQPQAKECISDNEYYLVEKMLNEGQTVEDIERLVRAFKGDGEGVVREHAMRRAEA